MGSDSNRGKKRVTSDDVREHEPGFWSNCIVVGDQFYIAGQVGKDRDGNLIGDTDPYLQSVQAFKNMQALAEAAGAKMNDIVKINVFLTDMRHRPGFIEARREFFSGDFPTAVVVGDVTLADDRLLVEIDAWGVIGCSGN